MTLIIRHGETQRSFVARVLCEQGEISAHEAMFALVNEDGRPKEITRLAPVIDHLRHQAGLDIVTIEPPGQQATYRLRGRVFSGRPVGRIRECPSCRRDHPVGTRCGQPT